MYRGKNGRSVRVSCEYVSGMLKLVSEKERIVQSEVYVTEGGPERNITHSPLAKEFYDLGNMWHFLTQSK